MDINHVLKEFLPSNRIKSRYIDVISYASDAGFYHLIPKAIVQPKHESEIIDLFKFSQSNKIPLVFRTGGTSLSGQSITDGILVDLSQYWNKLTIEDEGGLVRVQPGITGGMVNAHLKKYNRKIGPDPASISAAMIGGILSNNSSGMCCGVKLNSYHTVKYVRFILSNGLVYSTEEKSDYIRFQLENIELYTVLLNLRDEIKQNAALYDKIRKKYLTKNTVGYSLNAFIDFEHPLDILAHLLVGAEGTLAFISEVVMITVPDYQYKSTALLYFNSITDACNAIERITNSGALMVELMDRSSLRTVESMDGVPEIVKTLPAFAAALLIEYQANNQEDLKAQVEAFLAFSAGIRLISSPKFTDVPSEQALLWKVRKGLFPAVGAVRASGATVILEDIAFPVKVLGDAILELQQLFKEHDYTNAIIFGHAKDGNIHFVVTQSFSSDKEIRRYELFMEDVVDLVVKKYGGTLKAEHGTGRNMAPFVETEWGKDAYDIMKKVKHAIDCHAILNPGVIINDDAKVHLKNLKALPKVESEVDKCTECGYCEHVCPSRDLTTTPRRRIVIRRALKELEDKKDFKNYKLLKDQSQYESNETCAVDGLCAMACPVDINTGELTKRLRCENHSKSSKTIALWVAKNFKLVEKIIRVVLKTGNFINKVFGENTLFKVTSFIKKSVPTFPLWSKQIIDPPKLSALKLVSFQEHKNPDILYFPSCISRVLGSYHGKQKNGIDTFMSICNKLQLKVSVLDNAKGSCCGQIFSSKGFKDASYYTANNIIEHLWENSKEGVLPIVMDVSSCTYTLHNIGYNLTTENKGKFKKLRILDTVDFLNDMILPKAKVKGKKKRIVLHPVCSLKKMEVTDKFENIAKRFAEQVVVPKSAGCCGMAGDRGVLFPELITSATKHEAEEVAYQKYDGYYSSTKTCEMAMSEALKENYESILYLVDESI